MTVDTQKLRELLEQKDKGWPFGVNEKLAQAVPALLAENEALRAELHARQWQPIESAPDGVMILCADMKALEAKDWAFVAWLAGGKLCGHRCGMPTHWMPLPRPPAPPQGDGA